MSRGWRRLSVVDHVGGGQGFAPGDALFDRDDNGRVSWHEFRNLGAALLELIPSESADRDLQSMRGWLQEDLKSQHLMLASLNAQGFHGKSTLTHQIPQPCRQPHH